MTNQEAFDTNLSIGEKSEEIFIEKMKDRYSLIEKVSGEFKYFDIIAVKPDGSVVRIEVKHDADYMKTGNVPIEIGHRGKESGLKTSTADVWIMHLKDSGFWFAKGDVLKNCLLGHSEPLYNVYPGDGEDKSELILIPIESFKKIFKKLF